MYQREGETGRLVSEIRLFWKEKVSVHFVINYVVRGTALLVNKPRLSEI